MYLETSRAILRPWLSSDGNSLAKHANSPRIAAGMRDAFPHPYTTGDAHRFIEMATGNKNLFLAIDIGGEAVGGVGIHYLNDVYRGTGEIGYWLAEPRWGQGIITEVVSSLVPVVFRQTEIIRIQAGIFANNPASARVLEKSGFKREAVHKNAITKNGVVMDEILYAILKNRK